jgi:hypothetical protein
MMKSFHFLLRLAQVQRGIKSLSDRFALNPSSEAEVGPMPRIVRLGTVTDRLATFAGGSGNGTTAEITQIGDVVE